MSNPPPEDDPPLARPRARQASQREIQIEEDSDGDRPSRIEQEQFGRAVHAKYGKASFSGPAWVFLFLLGIALVVAVAYLLITRQADANGRALQPAQQCLTRDEFNESMRIRDEQMRARLDGIETSVTLLLVRTDPKR